MTRINQRWLLNKRPEGMPEDDCWKWEEVDVPELKDGEILIKSLYLSIDPYMRGRMNDAVSYTAPLQIGDVMVGESVGVVVKSKSDKFKLAKSDVCRLSKTGPERFFDKALWLSPDISVAISVVPDLKTLFNPIISPLT